MTYCSDFCFTPYNVQIDITFLVQYFLNLRIIIHQLPMCKGYAEGNEGQDLKIKKEGFFSVLDLSLFYICKSGGSDHS